MNNQLTEALKAACERAVEDNSHAGLNVLLLKDGEEVAYAEAGFRDVENGVGFKRDTISRLYSMSKPITGAAAMLLFERGVIDLQDPVSRYLPGFKNRKVLVDGKLVPEEKPVKLFDLLSMQSGLPYGGTSEAGRYAEALFTEAAESVDKAGTLSTVEFADRLGMGPGEFQPGMDWMYGTGADVMGAVIEVASGKRFGDFLQDEFFTPLGMKDTGFYIGEDKKDRLSNVYTPAENGQEKVHTTHLGISAVGARRPAFESGGAGLFSTIDDYAKFGQMLCNGGVYEGKRYLTKKTMKYFTAGQLYDRNRESFTDRFDNWHGYTYGNFLRIADQEGQAVTYGSKGEYGWDGWLGCHFAVLPKEKIVFVETKQLFNSGTERVSRILRNIAFSTLCDNE